MKAGSSAARRRRLRTPSILLLGLLLLACAVGCGGGSSGPVLTKSTYIARANAICKKGTEQLEVKIEKTFGTESPSTTEIASFTTGFIVPNLEAQLTTLRALSPPEADADTTAAIFDAMDSSINKLKDDPAASTDDATFTKLDSLASAYGLTDCVQS